MFKPHYGDCSKCGKTALIVVRAGLCQYCNQKKKGKTPKPLKRSTWSNVPRKPIQRTKLKYKRKKTGEYDMFLEIWEEREHICSVSGDVLIHQPGDDKFVNQFMHVVPKSMYPKLRLDKENIELGTPEIHHTYDHETDKAKADYRFDWLFEKRQRMKEKDRTL